MLDLDVDPLPASVSCKGKQSGGVDIHGPDTSDRRLIPVSVLEAAKLQFYTPPMANGRAVAWVDTIGFPVGM